MALFGNTPYPQGSFAEEQHSNRVSNEMLRDAYEHHAQRKSIILDHCIMVLEILKRVGLVSSYNLVRTNPAFGGRDCFDYIIHTYERRVMVHFDDGVDNTGIFEDDVKQGIKEVKLLQDRDAANAAQRGQQARTVAAVNGSFGR